MAHASVAPATVWYVDNNASPGGEGLSWQTAFSTVQTGINAAAVDDEVWVKYGTYYENISMKDGVALYGGFGDNAVSLDQRNWKVFTTVLDGSGIQTVIQVPNGQSPGTRIDGFTIRNGFNSGIIVQDSPVSVVNNIITGNTTNIEWWGGGIAIWSQYFSPTVENNIIDNNSSPKGGGIYCNSSANILKNKIINNQSTSYGYGAGIDIECSYFGCPTVANNFIIGNTNPSSYGGGISVDYGSPNITNNTIVGNTAYGGGGIFSRDSSYLFAVNNIVAFNSDGIMAYYNYQNPFLKNNDVFGNTNGNYRGGVFPDGVTPGPGDISLDPSFVDNTVGDYRLKAGSPCFNAGDNTVVQADWMDIDGESRVKLGLVDIGADELDDVPPVTSIALFGTTGDNGYYTSNVTFTLSANDLPVPGETGIISKEYSFDNVTWYTYLAPYTISAEGRTLVFYRSTDGAGNVETPQSPAQPKIIDIEKTAPIVLSTIPANNASATSRTDNVVVIFNETILPGSTYNNIQIRRGSQTGQIVTITGKTIQNGRHLQLAHGRLNRNTLYYVIVPQGAVKNAAGLNFATQFVFRFTTGSN